MSNRNDIVGSVFGAHVLCVRHSSGTAQCARQIADVLPGQPGQRLQHTGLPATQPGHRQLVVSAVRVHGVLLVHGGVHVAERDQFRFMVDFQVMIMPSNISGVELRFLVILIFIELSSKYS